MAVSVIVHDTFDAPGLARAWEDMGPISPRAGLFSTYDWCRCWTETVGAQTVPAILRVVDGESTIGIAPLCADRAGAVRWLRFMGRERVCGDHLDILCEPGRFDACMSAILDHLNKNPDSHDGLLLGELDRDSPTVSSLIGWARERGYRWLEREPRVVPYADLPKSFEDYLASRSKKMRFHIRRGRRQLESMPGGRMVIDQGEAAVDRLLEDFFALHHRRWERQGQTGNYRDPVMREFLRRFCHIAARNGWLRGYTVSIGNEAQAVLLAFHWGGSACFYQIGRDPDSMIESPGLLVIARSIEQAIGEGLSRYDFLQGDEPYKSRWTSQRTEQTTLLVGRRLPANVVIAMDRLKHRIKRALQPDPNDNTQERAGRRNGQTTSEPHPAGSFPR